MSKLDESRILIVGSNGQLGRALTKQYPKARAIDSDQLDISDQASVDSFDWTDIKVIINAAGYTNVDAAETSEGRVLAWQVNAVAVKNLVHAAWTRQLMLVHVSSDYVFDGTQTPHKEAEVLSPLSVYGASKAAGDLLAAQLDEHYIIRTSWVVGEGKNFVRTMHDLAKKGVSPAVVDDQIGRPTFTTEIARAIDHLLSTSAPFGTYNITNDGEPISWADVAHEVFTKANAEGSVTSITTAQYFAGHPNSAPRPMHSTLDLGKIQATGFASADWKSYLKKYIERETQR